jgi:hypothetical protein
MNDFRIASYESYLNSHSTYEIENEARNARLFKQLARNPRTRSLAARTAFFYHHCLRSAYSFSKIISTIVQVTSEMWLVTRST